VPQPKQDGQVASRDERSAERERGRVAVDLPPLRRSEGLGCAIGSPDRLDAMAARAQRGKDGGPLTVAIS
jgi:hypothetical protein